jgi:hypothetical protein
MRRRCGVGDQRVAIRYFSYVASDPKCHRRSLVSPRQQLALVALAGGATDQDAASVARVKRETVGRWRRHDGAFATVLSQLREQLFQEQTDELRSLLGPAIDALRDSLAGGQPAVRLRAALAVLDMLEVARADPTTPQKQESEMSVAEAIQQIETAHRSLETHRQDLLNLDSHAPIAGVHVTPLFD